MSTTLSPTPSTSMSTTLSSSPTPSTSMSTTIVRKTTSSLEIPIESSMSDNDSIINSSENNKINTIIDNLISYSEDMKRLYKEHKPLTDTFNKLKKLILDDKIPIIFTFLIDNYDANTDYIINHFYNIKDSNVDINNKHDSLSKLKSNIKKLKEQLETKERIYKMNMSEYNKMVYETNHLKNMLFISVILLIIPIIYIIGLLTKSIALIAFIGFACASIIFTANEIMSERDNRDNVLWNKLDIEAPDKNNITTEIPLETDTNKTA